MGVAVRGTSRYVVLDDLYQKDAVLIYYGLPRSAFDRDQITGKEQRSHAIR